MRGCAPYNMHFMEELFPDDAVLYRKLRMRYLRQTFLYLLQRVSPSMISSYSIHIYPMEYTITCNPICIRVDLAIFLHSTRKAASYSAGEVIPHCVAKSGWTYMSLHFQRFRRTSPTWRTPVTSNTRSFRVATPFATDNGFIPEKPGWGIEWSPDYKQYINGKETVNQ
jgi:hypothetical protein